MARYALDPVVEDELWEIWTYIATDNPTAATAVIEAAYATFQTLAANPRMGATRKFRPEALRQIRTIPIIGYRNYLVFYRVAPGRVQILHVCHGARDLEALLDRE